jgi:hypothetical protein
VSEFANSGAHEVVARATRWQDLTDVWEFENRFFGADNVSWQTLRDWWWRYSRFALHVRDSRGQVVGTFDASPIEPHAFAGLLDGTFTERDLSMDRIRPPRRGETVSHWCMSSLTTCGSMAERLAILAALGRGIVERLDRLPEVGWPSRWCAVAQSTEGRRMLERAGFRRHRDDSAVYAHELNCAEDLRALRGHIASAADILMRRNARGSLPVAA